MINKAWLKKNAIDEDFMQIFQDLAQGKTQEPFTLDEGFLLHGSRLCVVKELYDKIFHEYHSPPYAGHHGIQATTQAIETYF